MLAVLGRIELCADGFDQTFALTKLEPSVSQIAAGVSMGLHVRHDTLSHGYLRLLVNRILVVITRATWFQSF